MEAAAIPFPRLETTPPVMKMNLAMPGSSNVWAFSLARKGWMGG
jgi:hypothetical protein